MPYIKQDERKQYEKFIGDIIQILKKVPAEQQDGALNYIVSKILLGVYEPRYFNFNRAVGVLECIKQEFYRRFVAGYEDKKIKENGDIT
ncbi:MAG: hypothetical protein V1886_03775 [archaeon]